MIARLARFKDEVADGYVLGVVRVGVGTLLGLQALFDASVLERFGYFGDFFHMPTLPEALVPSSRAYALLIALRVLLAALVMLGSWARPSLAVSSVVGFWLLLCDDLQPDPNRYSLSCYALLLALTPCDRSFCTHARLVRGTRTGPFWAVRLAQMHISMVYLVSGGAKLLDPEWRSGVALAGRLAHASDLSNTSVLRVILRMLAGADASSAIAKLAIMSELAMCVALWIRPTRIVALWWGVWFHILVLAALGDAGVTWLTAAMYGVFAIPDYQARKLHFDPSRLWGKLAGIVVPQLDWLGRFEVQAWEPDGKPGHSVVVVRRDGERVTGVRAFAMVARCLPLLFPVWGPLALIASFTRQGDLTSAS